MPSPPSGTDRSREAADAALAIAGAHAAYEAQDIPRALVLIDQAIAARPTDPEAWNAKGVFLRVAGRFHAAIGCYRRAIGLDPRSGGAWSNLGNAHKDLGQFACAAAAHARATALRPHDAGTWHNRGVGLAATGRHREALAAFDRALLLRPGDRDMRWDRALSALAAGDLAQGWVDYEARLGGLLPEREHSARPWRGQPFAGQTLLVTAEQGFGDAIWAARFLPRAKSLGGTVILETRPELVPLLAMLGAVDRFVARGDALPPAEWRCPICSLPGLFTPDADAIDGTPYLRTQQDRMARLTPYVEADGALKVGIVWSGSVTFKGNAERACDLERFVSAFALPGVQMYSLQKGPPAKALRRLPHAPVRDLGPHLADFADTAAAVRAMDLVIMTDSAVAHLAGALGVEVWLLLGTAPYWLWMQEPESSPWYRSMTLFRQRVPGDWTGPFDAATARLMAGMERPDRDAGSRIADATSPLQATR